MEEPTEVADLLGFVPMDHLLSVTSVSLLVRRGEQIVSHTITTSSVQPAPRVQAFELHPWC